MIISDLGEENFGLHQYVTSYEFWQILKTICCGDNTTDHLRAGSKCRTRIPALNRLASSPVPLAVVVTRCEQRLYYIPGEAGSFSFIFHIRSPLVQISLSTCVAMSLLTEQAKYLRNRINLFLRRGLPAGSDSVSVIGLCHLPCFTCNHQLAYLKIQMTTHFKL